jgi:hypothetical protein
MAYHEQSQLREEIKFREWQGEPANDEYFVADIEKEAGRQEKDAIATYGMLEGADARISPLCRALADVGVLSIHGTSTGANVSYMFLLAESLLKFFNRRKTRRKSGMISSHVLLVMQCSLWLRKVYWGTQREDRLHGR